MFPWHMGTVKIIGILDFRSSQWHLVQGTANKIPNHSPGGGKVRVVKGVNVLIVAAAAVLLVL